MGRRGELECAGPGDGRCPYGRSGAPEPGVPVYRCADCRERWELDELVPERRTEEDDGPTPPWGDPGEAGRGAAA
ncbi:MULTISPECIES: hypothetical protein [Streptomyces]|nr:MULTISPECIES: hypothetical protein [Streptomyces]MDN5381962.1 hypothetical protein [Streptomyces sp. LB8]